MLRLLVLLLVLANVGHYAWEQGLLTPIGLAPVSQTEPQRLAEQIRPDMLRLLPAAESPKPAASTGDAANLEAASPVAAPALPASAASAPLPPLAEGKAFSASAEPVTATQCLQAGIYNEEQTAALRSRLQAQLPAGSWVLESSVEPARWLVYMGRYANAEALAKKRSELRARRISFEALDNPALEPGLSLGSFGSQAEAETELTRVAGLGVKTARVLQSRAELRGQRLKLAAVDSALRSQLENLKPELFGKTLQACR
jgi:hypothetical protein